MLKSIKTKWTLSLVCLSLLAACSSQDSSQKHIQQDKYVILPTSSTSISTKHITRKSDNGLCKTDIYYPKLSQLANKKINDKLNKELGHQFIATASKTLGNCADNHSAVETTIYYRLHLNDDKLTCLEQKKIVRNGQAIQTSQHVNYLTIDTETGNNLQLADLFAPAEVPLQIIHEMADLQLKRFVTEEELTLIKQQQNFPFYVTNEQLSLAPLAQSLQIEAAIHIPFMALSLHPSSLLYSVWQRQQQLVENRKNIVFQQLRPLIATAAGIDAQNIIEETEIAELLDSETAWTNFSAALDNTFGLKTPRIRGHLSTTNDWVDFVEHSLFSFEKLKQVFSKAPWHINSQNMSLDQKIVDIVAQTHQKLSENSEYAPTKKALLNDFYYSLEAEFEVPHSGIAAYANSAETMSDWLVFIENWPAYRTAVTP
ncbi:MAG: hypothetical protein ACPG5B_17660 [Chitinophagales bacterium]